MDRRAFVSAGVAAAAAAAFVVTQRGSESPRVATDGRIAARPAPFVAPGAKIVVGSSSLGMGGARDGIIVIPPNYSHATPAPLLVGLHGAGGAGERFGRTVTGLAADLGAILVAPDSRGGSWDAIRGSYGADVEFIDKVLARVFKDYNIDPARVTICGFSDGATYALSLGLINGDLFTRIAAFSPGFIVPGAAHGKPAVFVSHGRSDPILPFRLSDEQIVPELTTKGYRVTFFPFDGGHSPTAEVLATVTPWLRAPSAPRP